MSGKTADEIADEYIRKAGRKPRTADGHTNGKGDGKEAHSWDDPDISLLDDRRGDLPRFPLYVFSEKLQRLIKRTSKGAGVTPAHVAVPLIGVTSGVIGFARASKLPDHGCNRALVGQCSSVIPAPAKPRASM